MSEMKVKIHQFFTRINQRGQIAVEYILLLAVGVSLWLLLVNTLVSRNPQSPGMIIKKWVQIINLIGGDEIEKK
jgi:hypothetical protein